MGKDRIAYLDLVKFVAILLVCIGHCYVMSPNLESSIRPIIYSFHMPLFMLLCGYFSPHSLEFSIRTLVVKKGKQLLIPVVSCTILTIVLVGGELREELIGCVWFFKTLFVCYLIAKVTKCVKIPIEITFLLSWVVLLFIPFGGTLMINFLYFYFCMNWTVPCDKVDINLLINSPMTFFIQIFVGLSGAIVVIGICELIYKFFGKKRIAENILSKLSIIGRYTLGIYVVQTFIIERSVTKYIKLNEVIISSTFTDFIFIPLIGFVLCLICYYIVCLTQPIKIINILFYGNQQ